ncbi:hypothetical protein SAMN02982989_3194 [Xaviernesmea oryzae]|uniref:Uncharacterized protein n=1 Tax=Xaviernesmea oryzae TaxID=464029 RepID=A0A1X7FKV8_9HYPH|nr:hypothetical protein [Xaviernesmea oryzae]SMF53319.1 hypothetical protein SAMN02982989_3194 [Xaviernesmea oryzae]
MSEFISYLFAIFVVTPLQAELSERLQGVPSQEIIQAGRACIAVEGPQLLQFAQDNWGWAVANGLGVAAGLVDPVTLLPPGNENCQRVVQALGSREADA